MKISTLDDYFDTLRTLRCFRKLDAHEVEIWNDHVEDLDTLATRLKHAEVLSWGRIPRVGVHGNS